MFEAELVGTRNALRRLVFAHLSGGRWFWLFVVGVPIPLFVGSRFYPRLLSVLVGICLLFLLAFWGSNYRYLRSRVTIDSGRRTLTLEHPDTPFVRSQVLTTEAATVELDDVKRVSIVLLGDAAMVRLEYRSMRLFSPPDFVVEQSDLRETISALRSSGVTISSDSSDEHVESTPEPAWDRMRLSWRRPTEPVIRIVTISLVLVGIPVYAVLEAGPSVVIGSNAGVIGVVLWAWMAGRHLTLVLGVRPSGRWSRSLLEATVTGVLLMLLIVSWTALQIVR